jgi:type IV secretory pathway TraG/TraD family ATPase VirD4
MCTPYPGKHFDPATMLDSTNGYPTLYLLAQRDQVVAVTDVLGALMDEILHLAREVAQRSENNRLDPPLRLLADEATNTANLTQLPTLIADGGGRGMPTTVVVQDRADATDRWGRERALSMWGAATIRMVLPGVAGGEEMREIAAYFDEYDEEIPSFSRSTGPMGTSEQYSLRTRTAMTAAAVRSIPSFHSLVIAAGGLRPVLTELTPYYQRPDAARTADAEKEFYAALNAGRTLR